MVAVGLWGFFVFATESIKFLKLTIVDLFISLFIGYQVLHFFVFSEDTIVSLFVWRRMAFVGFYVILKWLYNFYGKAFLKRLVFILTVKVIVETIFGVVQYFGFINSVRSIYFDVIGTFSSPNYFSYALCIGLLISVWYVFENYKALSNRLKYLIATFSTISVWLLITLKSRAALVALIFCCCLFIIKKKSNYLKKLNLKTKIISITIIAICFCIGGNLLYELKKDSANSRLLVTKITWNEIKNKPVLGHGLFTFSKGYNIAKANYFQENERDWNEIKVGDYINAAMNDYLQIAYETGFIGILLLMTIFWLLFYYNSDSNYVTLGLLLTTFFMITALFSSVHYHEHLVVMGIIGFVIAQDGLKTKEIRFYKFKSSIPMKATYGLFFALILSVGTLKLYSKNWIRSSLRQKELVNQIPIKKWDLWSYVHSNNGLSQFGYGKILYKYYNKKEEGLQIMEYAISKDVKPKNVKQLAVFYAEQKRYNDAEQLFTLNKFTQPYRYEPKMDLLLLYDKTQQQNEFCEIAKEVVSFPVKIPSEKVTNYKRICKNLLQKNHCD